jgi:uncharacterized membrane protein
MYGTILSFGPPKLSVGTRLHTMSNRESRPSANATADLFDKYTLPKIALVIILVAALVGTWVTSSMSGRSGIVFALTKWAYFVALGIVTGGLLWKHAFVRPADLGEGASEYCAEMYERFDRLVMGTLIFLVAGGGVVLGAYRTQFGLTPGVGIYASIGIALLAVLLGTSRGNHSVTEQFRSPAGLTSLALALGLVVATAILEVGLRGFEPGAATVRVLHLLAYAVWIGGAVWNIFVAVPTGQNRPSLPVVHAAGEQLERFRWAVRFIIPTLILTGIYQAIDGVGVAPETYLNTVVGVAVLAKLGFIGLLVVIFLLCPMWRACSPIDGVCDLEDIGGSAPADGDAGVAGDD